MVLTRSIATTTNNVQGDEPCLTALERQVQTLTAAVERLTKQNQVLEEQLRQKAVNGTQEEDQKGASAKQRDQKGLEGVTTQVDRSGKT